jgi:hypothetical protein
MTFRASLFKNDRKQTEKQPDYTGPGSIAKEAFMALADAITSGKCQLDDRGEIKVRVAGWKRESAGGRAYISLSLSLDDYQPQETATKPAAKTTDDDSLF